MTSKSETVLFSGRFDPVHLGHIDTITDLGLKYSTVLVVILDHASQMYPVQFRSSVLLSILDKCIGNYVVTVNDIHFGNISTIDLSAYNFNVYASGNMNCLRRMERLGYKIEYISRSGDVSASDMRMAEKIKTALKEN